MPLPLVGAAMLPLAMAALRVFIIANVVGWVTRILAAFGFVFYVLEPVTDTLMSLLAGQFGVLPPMAAAWVGFLNIDKFVSLWISAHGIRQTANFVLRLDR